MTQDPVDLRAVRAVEIATAGGAEALRFFRQLESLVIESKGPQDFVSAADRQVELLVRGQIEAAFPDDGIVGEEHAPKPSRSGFTWVIDPIDGTTNFVTSIPQWVVVIAVVQNDQTVIGVTHDPVHGETFTARRGQGATLNGAPLRCPAGGDLKKGSIGTGYSNRVGTDGILNIVSGIMAQGGMFHRNASGALSLAYVAAGRLIGYVEEHMNAWDCLAGQLLIAEAGGCIEPQSADAMIRDGGRVVAGQEGVFKSLQTLANQAFPQAK